MKIVVHPAATAELNKAEAFYSAQANKQLGLALIAEFEKSALFLPDQLFVIAIAHQKRRPDYWHRRK